MTKKSSPRSPCLMIVVPLPYLTASKLSRSSSFSGACGGRARRLPRRRRNGRPGGTRAAALEERVRRHGLADELLDGVGLGDDLLRVVAEVDAVAADALVVVLRVDARERELRGRCRRIDQNSGVARRRARACRRRLISSRSSCSLMLAHDDHSSPVWISKAEWICGGGSGRRPPRSPAGPGDRRRDLPSASSPRARTRLRPWLRPLLFSCPAAGRGARCPPRKRIQNETDRSRGR